MPRNDEALVGGFHAEPVPDQRFLRAEGAGFEPAGPEGPTVFKTVPFVRSGTPPSCRRLALARSEPAVGASVPAVPFGDVPARTHAGSGPCRCRATSPGGAGGI